MATITEVRWIERAGRRKQTRPRPGAGPPVRTPTHAEIALDGERWLTLPKRWLRRHDLHEGRELSEAELAEFEDIVVEKLGLFVCLMMLENGAKTRSQLEAKLSRYGLPEHLRERSLDRVAEMGLADDEAEIAASLCRGARNKGCWRGRAAQKIRERGIDATLAEPVLDEHFPAEDEAEAAAAALPARLHGDPRKGAAWLVRRGFSYGCTSAAYSRLAIEEG